METSDRDGLPDVLALYMPSPRLHHHPKAIAVRQLALDSLLSAAPVAQTPRDNIDHIEARSQGLLSKMWCCMQMDKP